MPKVIEEKVVVWATRPFGYNIPKNGPEMDRGQIFELEGFPGDDRLKRLGYVEILEAPKGWEPYICPECGAGFMESTQRAAHVKKRHKSRRDAREEDQLEDSELRELNKVAPIHFDNTEASRKN